MIINIRKIISRITLLMIALSLVLSNPLPKVFANSPDDQRPTPEEILKEKGVELISNNFIDSPVVVEAVLSKAVNDYKNERKKHRKQMPLKMSIALVKQYDNKYPLILENNVEKHWTYENGKITESEFSLGYGPPDFSKVSFAIFNEGKETFVQLDEGWYFYHAGGAQYKAVKDSSKKINLIKVNDNWHE